MLRSACALSAVWSAPLFFFAHYKINTQACFMQNVIFLARLFSWASWFESLLGRKTRRLIFSRRGPICCITEADTGTRWDTRVRVYIRYLTIRDTCRKYRESIQQNKYTWQSMKINWASTWDFGTYRICTNHAVADPEGVRPNPSTPSPFLNTLWKWNNLVSVRYLRKMR